MNILLVEDVGSLANTLAGQLKAAGHHVDHAYCISLANGYLKGRGPYDCLIVDLNMDTTGLPANHAEKTHNGLFTGWIWLREVVFPAYAKFARRTIVLTAYRSQFCEHFERAEYEDIVLLGKGEVTEADSLLREDELLAAVRRIGGSTNEDGHA